MSLEAINVKKKKEMIYASMPQAISDTSHVKKSESI